jgi:hypothetical protein
MRDMRFTTLSWRMFLCAALLGVLGGCRRQHILVPSDSGSTAADACRAPDEPGCSRCCIPKSHGSCTLMYWPTDSSHGTQGLQPWYLASEERKTCPSDCRPCARCTRRHEQEIQWLGVRPECDCTKPTGSDPCIEPESCNCYCSSMKALSHHCPDLVPREAASRK